MSGLARAVMAARIVDTPLILPTLRRGLLALVDIWDIRKNEKGEGPLSNRSTNLG